jgi:hypothetical protein
MQKSFQGFKKKSPKKLKTFAAFALHLLSNFIKQNSAFLDRKKFFDTICKTYEMLFPTILRHHAPTHVFCKGYLKSSLFL